MRTITAVTAIRAHRVTHAPGTVLTIVEDEAAKKLDDERRRLRKESPDAEIVIPDEEKLQVTRSEAERLVKIKAATRSPSESPASDAAEGHGTGGAPLAFRTAADAIAAVRAARALGELKAIEDAERDRPQPRITVLDEIDLQRVTLRASL